MRMAAAGAFVVFAVMGAAPIEALAACPTPGEPASSMGCVFYAVDLKNDGTDASTYSVAVVNPDPALQANVEVQIRVGGTWIELRD